MEARRATSNPHPRSALIVAVRGAFPPKQPRLCGPGGCSDRISQQNLSPEMTLGCSA
jgi:hypothetical protein